MFRRGCFVWEGVWFLLCYYILLFIVVSYLVWCLYCLLKWFGRSLKDDIVGFFVFDMRFGI